MVTNVLIRERDTKIEDIGNGELYTHSPNDIFKIFTEVFDVLCKKPMKELVLGVLEILHEVFSQYQRALYQMINMETRLKIDYLIAINNNFSKFFDFIEVLLDPVRKNSTITEEEINQSFDQRTVQQLFSKITTKIISRITDSTFLKVQVLYHNDFLNLDMDDVLNKSFKIFEDVSVHMNKQTAREAWKSFLRKTVIEYIQIMLNSSLKIKKQSGDLAITKLQEDYDKVYDMFSDVMTKRLLKSGLEVLSDLKNFFESSVEFLSFNIGKMRQQHGPAFNLTTVKALLNLRVDLDKIAKTQVLVDAKEVLEKYKDEAGTLKEGIFNQVDTNEAVKEFNEDMKDPEEAKNAKNNKGKVQADDSAQPDDADQEEEFNIDDFLKEGGINMDEVDEKVEETEAERLKREKDKNKKDKNNQKEVKKIVGREDM